MKNKQRISNGDLFGGILFVIALVYFAIEPLSFIQLDRISNRKYTGVLIALLICNMVGVWFNVRHKDDPLTVTGRVFNYLTATASFFVMALTLPLLHEISPVLVYTILLAALLSVVSLRIPDESWTEVSLAAIAVVPLLARYGLGFFSPSVEPESYWLWIEILFGAASPVCIFLLNHKSEEFLGAGPRARWIWIHMFHSIFIALVILVMYRGNELALIAKVKDKFSDLNSVELGAVAATAALATEGDADEHVAVSDEERESLARQGGTLAIVTTVLWAFKMNWFSSLMRGEPIDYFIAPIFLLVFLTGLWAVFDHEVPAGDRALGGAVCYYFGLMLGGILLLMLL